MNSFLFVFLGAGVGGSLRHLVNMISPKLFGAAFPYHTLIVNILGSFAMGLIAGYFALRGDQTQTGRLFLMTGVLGGFTTFSSFSLDAVLLYERGDMIGLLTYILVSVGVSIGSLFLGLYLMRTFA